MSARLPPEPDPPQAERLLRRSHSERVLAGVCGGGVGDRTERPSSPADLRDYRLAIGQLTLDLSGLQVPQGTTTVQARVGVGELAVRLPEGVAVEVDAGSGIGQVQALDREESGVGSRLEADSGGFGDRRLVLDLRVGLGEVRVER